MPRTLARSTPDLYSAAFIVSRTAAIHSPGCCSLWPAGKPSSNSYGLLALATTSPLAASNRIVFVLCVPLSMPMKYSLIFPGSQVLCCVVVAGFSETIKRNRRQRGKGSAPPKQQILLRAGLEKHGSGVIIRASYRTVSQNKVRGHDSCVTGRNPAIGGLEQRRSGGAR